MSNKDIFPCKNCNDREVGCHSFCEEYIEAKAKYDNQTAKIKRIKKFEEDARGFAVDTHKKMKKRYNNKKYYN